MVSISFTVFTMLEEFLRLERLDSEAPKAASGRSDPCEDWPPNRDLNISMDTNKRYASFKGSEWKANKTRKFWVFFVTR
jgi:hypothetical protein